MLKGIFYVVVVIALYFAGAIANALPNALPPEQQEIAKDLSAYMNGLEHIKANFVQYSGNSVSAGVAIIDYPRHVSVEYMTPKHISITYDKSNKNMVRYYDHRLKQERMIRVQINALNLLLEDDWEHAINIKRIDVMETLYVAHVLYENENLTLSFKKSPIELKSIRVTGKVHNKKAAVNMEFSNIEQLR